MPLVEKRYAQALLELSFADITNVRQEFLQFVEIFNSDKDFRDFLLDPTVKLDKKQGLIREVFTGRLSKNMLNFILVLIAKQRINELPGIFRQFVYLADSKANVLDMKVITFAALEEGQLNSLKEKFGKIYKASAVKITEIVDPSIIGGIKVVIGDKVYDGSIKGRIESLTELVNI
ncbi:ATP synthase subunit delta [Ruminiclostridium hungatei]|uniref:ATP synthase subunit delta n=1 Tax=Ruminiclostridium hungatei TaxID=48256 RepID=A0A1V4SLU0_RUMHU|nr:ATP synthase F1 subunit delta [Ruminiclostridium hungatei]OPX44852.1 ATP synthase subunit delta [Ruminiclostridium hungatei]